MCPSIHIQNFALFLGNLGILKNRVFRFVCCQQRWNKWGRTGDISMKEKKSAESFSGILVPKSGIILIISFTKRGIEKFLVKIYFLSYAFTNVRKVDYSGSFLRGKI